MKERRKKKREIPMTENSTYSNPSLFKAEILKKIIR